MTKVIIRYTTDQDGNPTNPETGKFWNIPEEMISFKKNTEGRSIICDRHTFEQNWHLFQNATKIAVITKQEVYFQTGIGLEIASRLQRDHGLTDLTSHIIPLAALTYLAVKLQHKSSVYCVGLKRTIEAMAPFASRVVATDVCRAPESPDDHNDYPIWIPKHIRVELPEAAPESGAWTYFAENVGTHENLNWRFAEMLRVRPIEF